jgi:hypothetical protein
MENFFNYIAKPLPEDDVNIWFSVNNLIPEKSELFYDFCISLYDLMTKTYLGEITDSKETKVNMNDEDNLNHFQWCWLKTIDNFKKENIFFSEKGSHFDYFQSFFMEVYYNQQDDIIKNSIKKFIDELFDKTIPFTKSDLDLYTEIYKLLDKGISK